MVLWALPFLDRPLPFHCLQVLSLDLSGTFIGDAGAAVLAEHLIGHRKLSTLWLAHCDLSPAGLSCRRRDCHFDDTPIFCPY